MVIVGFQARGTTGRLLVEGAKKVKIFREDVAVKAQVHTIGGFSAHADRDELLAWLAPHVHPGLVVNLIHGEEEASLAFQRVARERFPEVTFHIPGWRESAPLGSFAEAPERIDEAAWADRADRLHQRVSWLDDMLAGGRLNLDEASLRALEHALDQVERLGATG